MMSRLLFVFLAFASHSLSGQLPNRYIEEVFTGVEETYDVIFSTNVPQPKNDNTNFYSIITGLPLAVKEYDTEPVTLQMDIYEPSGDVSSERPLVIVCFGGGFIQGSRKHFSIIQLCQGLARRGYVTAAIDYRLGMNLFDQDLGARAVYRAVQDSRSAVRFFRANASTYRIDVDQIFIGGHSAGAFVALHNLYLDKESERPASTFLWTQNSMNDSPDLDCLDCVGDHLGFNGKANGVFSLAGAMGDTGYIESSVDAPPILFHSSDDGTVPYNVGEPFSDVSGLIFGSDLPTVYGSVPINQRCIDLGIPVEFNSYTNRGHGVHENGMVLHTDILPAISSWFYEQYLRRPSNPIAGNVRFCDTEILQNYEIDPEEFIYFDWQVTGGQIASGSTSSETITIEWDSNAPQREVQIIPYLANGAQGETQSLIPSIAGVEPNVWTGSDGAWNNAENWSTGHLPLSCDIVEISGNVNVTLPTGTSYQIESLDLKENAQITIPSESILLISEK